MNYTQMFANGGKTSDQELIKGIQKILGVDDAQMEQLLQIGINKYGSLEGIGQALNEATQGLTPNSSPEEVQAAIASVFQTNAESQMFKCGGKLQQLVTRFGKGGGIDCGCGGIKIGQEGFKTSGSGTDPDAGFHTGDIEITPQKDTIVNYSYPSYNGKAILTPNGGTVKEWLNGDSLPTVYRDRNWFARHPRRALLPFIGNLNNAKIMNARELAQNHIPSQKEGGEIEGNDKLTIRAAKALGRRNRMQENDAQGRFSYANALNAARSQGLRGSALRQEARRRAAGIDRIPTIEEDFNIQDLPQIEAQNTVIDLAPDNIPVVSKMNIPRKQYTTDGTQASNWYTETGDLTKQLSGPVNDYKPQGNRGTPPKQRAESRTETENGAFGYRKGSDGNVHYFESQDVPQIPAIVPGIPMFKGLFGLFKRKQSVIPSQQQVASRPTMSLLKGQNFQDLTSLKCGGTVKSKEGIKLAKCGKKVKK